MSVSLLTNADSLAALANLQADGRFQSQTIRRMSSGYRISTAGDDPAGLAAANQYRRDTAELTQGVRNANDGIGSLQIIDGGMSNIASILDRLKTLATQSASQSFSGDRKILNSEFQTLLGEINRQAQSIGLNQSGQFARVMPIYLGGTTGDSVVTVDLSASAVDTTSLGLGIAGATGLEALGIANIGPSSPDHTVQQILADPANAPAGSTTFCFTGPGFSDGNQIVATANLQSVSDINSLVAAINAAIQVAANGSSAGAAAFKSANLVASVHTDAGGGQELAFQSTTAAFQVAAGDRMANAFLGNLSGSSGNPLTTSFTGLVPAAGVTAGAVNVQVSGGSLATPVVLSLNTGATTASLVTAVSTSPQLQAAGITASASAANGQLTFADARGETFSVQATGDTANVLGLGTFVAGSGAGVDYTSIQGAYDNTTTFGTVQLEFSFNGAPSIALPAIDLAGGNASGGNSRTIDDLANALNTDFATIPGLKGAGLVAAWSGTSLTIRSNDNTYFRINPANSTADLGFGVAGLPFSATLSAASANAQPIDSEGASGVAPLAFTPMSFGGDTQSLTVSAQDSSGVQHTQLITLRNDNQGRQGSDIDEAIASINTQLQGDGTLAKIVAVKEVAGGVEQINFLSSLPSFTVSVGTSANGDGMNGGAPVSEDSSPLGGSNYIGVETQEGAAQAIAAIASAVGKLGAAQAVVGKGENQLTYALNLGQSQITNFSAAESGIRDADVAAEAANLSKAQILRQATIAAMAQANTAPQAILALLRG